MPCVSTVAATLLARATTPFCAIVSTPCATVIVALSPTTRSVPAPAWTVSPSAPPMTMSAPLPVVIVSGPPSANAVESIWRSAIGNEPNVANAEDA